MENTQLSLFIDCYSGSVDHVYTMAHFERATEDLRYRMARSLNNDPNERGSALQFMADDCDKHSIEKLVAYGADVNLTTEDKTVTPLIKAVRFGNYSAVKALLKANANVNLVDKKGDTALHIAARQGRIKILNLILKYNPDISICNYKLKTVVDDIVYYNFLEVAKTIVYHYYSNGKLTPIISDYFITYFSEQKQHHVVEILLESGANPNLRNSGVRITTSTTPLLCAFRNRDTMMTALLLSHGAKFCRTSHSDLYYLYYAVLAQYYDGVKIALAGGCEVTYIEINEASESGRLDILELLLSHFGGIGRKGGNYHLVMRSDKHFPEIQRTLMISGIDQNVAGWDPSLFDLINYELRMRKRRKQVLCAKSDIKALRKNKRRWRDVKHNFPKLFTKWDECDRKTYESLSGIPV
jgi:ankyrin repeat protein